MASGTMTEYFSTLAKTEMINTQELKRLESNNMTSKNNDTSRGILVDWLIILGYN